MAIPIHSSRAGRAPWRKNAHSTTLAGSSDTSVTAAGSDVLISPHTNSEKCAASTTPASAIPVRSRAPIRANDRITARASSAIRISAAMATRPNTISSGCAGFA